ncbi:signal peptidase I [Thermoactinomyces sp. DSM 45891]|uniref:signal peptidase I n=1 Tax=Thermoactinomyces sp. DSM 45891 TaxID=1761907 RepID=UPI0009193143|nr:signal peptidase I [Thermoactinomyces sp. DSM 45891]SFX64709.1 signal peptidase I [Thermoactinomyces sp. DSM 45891]
MQKIVKQSFSWFFSILLGIVVALILSIYVVQPTKVLGKSMEPTLHEQEQIIISKLPNTFNYHPDYGEIVIIDSRVTQKRSFKDDLYDNGLVRLITGNHSDNIWIKRVIGKPGDVIDIKDNQLYRNGEKLNETYIKEAMNSTNPVEVQLPYTIPKDSVFVLGDNRNHSRDSRSIGAVPIDHVLGVALFTK